MKNNTPQLCPICSRQYWDLEKHHVYCQKPCDGCENDLRANKGNFYPLICQECIAGSEYIAAKKDD